MPTGTLKWIILTFSLVIGLLVLAQLFWLNKVYRFEKKEFSNSVIKSIKGVYEDLELIDSSPTHLQKLIEQPTVESFLFKIDSIPQQSDLQNVLLANLEDFEVFADCKVGLYDNELSRYLYTFYLPSAITKYPLSKEDIIPLVRKNYTYILLYFPHRSQYILYAMAWWISSALFLLVILIALAFSVFSLLRQKFLNEVQNDFIRNVTHEFQTPLTTLTVGLEAISRDDVIANPERRHKYIQLMQGQANYLKLHIGNLIKVLQAESGGLPVKRQLISPNTLIHEAISQLNPVIEEKHATIRLNLETHGTIFADKAGMYLVILNLISNALKYSIDPQIEITTTATHPWYIVSIKDNGIGIEKKFIKKLYKKFFRVPTGDVHDVKGLGLGLYFAKKVVDAHRGTIQVSSQPGKGTAFTIRLILKDE